MTPTPDEVLREWAADKQPAPLVTVGQDGRVTRLATSADLARELLDARRVLREIEKYGSAYGGEHVGLGYFANLARSCLPAAEGG